MRKLTSPRSSTDRRHIRRFVYFALALKPRVMPDSQPWTAADIPELSGKVAIVTGGNAGIGEISVMELARHGAKVYLAARSPTRAEESLGRLKKQLEPADFARIVWLPLDLADLESVKAAVEEFESKENKLHILMNSAGVMATPYSFTKQGLELQNGIHRGD